MNAGVAAGSAAGGATGGSKGDAARTSADTADSGGAADAFAARAGGPAPVVVAATARAKATRGRDERV